MRNFLYLFGKEFSFQKAHMVDQLIKSMPVILMIDDNNADIELVKEAVNDGAIQVEIQAAYNAVQSFTYFRKLRDDDSQPKPTLIILDLNLPIFSGEIILDYIKSEPHLQDIPIVIWTSSTFKDDPAKYKSLGANEFIVKPMNYSDYRLAVQDIKRRYIGE